MANGKKRNLSPIWLSYSLSLSYRIEPKPINTGIQPKPQDVFHLLDNEWISVVQVGLFYEVLMQVELLPLLPELPHGTSESTDPVCRWYWISIIIDSFRIFPYIEFGVGMLEEERLLKPLVLVTWVIEDEIEDNFESCEIIP